LAFVTVLCCSRAASSQAQATQSAAQPAASVEQKLASLKAEFPEANVQLDAARSRVARIQNLKADPGASSAINLTRSVLKNPAVARALGVSSDLRELCEPVTRNDPQLPSYAVVRMQQCVDGVKVLGAELVMSVRLTPSPAIDTLTSSLRPDLPESMVPKIDAAQAIAAAASARDGAKPETFGAGSSAAARPSVAPELTVFVPSVFQLEGPPRLCWLVRRDAMVILVDAATGAIVHRYADAQRGA
jgi:hypothetical protein